MIKDWINIKNEKEINNIGSFNEVKKIINDDLKSFLINCDSKEKNILEMVTIKSRSKKGVVDKIKALKKLGIICAEINGSNSKDKKEQAINEIVNKEKEEINKIDIKNKQRISGIKNEYTDNEKYFKSEAHKIIFYLLEYDGKERMDKLNVYKAHYLDKALAKSWYTNLAKIVHPDKTDIYGGEKAMAELASMYEKMIKNG